MPRIGAWGLGLGLAAALWPEPLRAHGALDARTFLPPAGRAATITIAEPILPAHATLLTGLSLGYARGLLERRVRCDTLSPTVIDSTCVRGDRDGSTAVLTDIAELEPSVALALYETLQLGASMPLLLVRVADDFAHPARLQNEPALGDLRLSLDAPLLHGKVTALGIGFVASFPTGDEQHLVGAHNWTATPSLVYRVAAGYRMRGAARLGYRLREPAAALGFEHDDELELALGLAIAVLPGLAHAATGLEIHAEARGLFGVGGEAERSQKALELDAALAWLAPSGFSLLGGFGAGVVRGAAGYGAPDLRVFVVLRQPFELARCGRFSRDPACGDANPDGDSVAGADDQCPYDVEDADGFADQDGCPDHDDDADGLPDHADQCPHRTEDRNGRGDEDGCPEATVHGGPQKR